MAIDYSKFSLEELQSALGGIDRERHPGNFQALKEQIALRQAAPAGTAPSEAVAAMPEVPRYAGGLTRLAATLVDGLILIPMVFLYFPLGAKSFPLAVLGFLLMQAVSFYYQIWFHARYGATPGKMALGIKVVDESFAPIGFRTALKRSSVDIGLRVVLSLFALGNLLAYEANFPLQGMKELAAVLGSGTYNLVNHLVNLWTISEGIVCLTNKRRKAIHDYIAGTVVIHRGSPQA